MIQSVKPNGHGRQGPPDLTEFFNKVGSKGIIGVAILVLMIWGAFSAFYTVQPEERARGCPGFSPNNRDLQTRQLPTRGHAIDRLTAPVP